MQKKTQRFTNFSRAVNTISSTVRPNTEAQLEDVFSSNAKLLARGNGLSYSDCCVNNKETIIDTSRLNHILSFEPTTGIVVCQAAVTFADLFLIDPHFIPPVIPGTLHATVAGGVANDVHGKNNPHAGSFGHHIEWIELQLHDQLLRCSPTENTDLFKATVAGLGLTGIIKRVAIRMHKASRTVTQQTEKFTHFSSLLEYMQQEGIHDDYQVAWLDLLNAPRALLSLANHIAPAKHQPSSQSLKHRYTMPKVPIRLVSRFFMKQFNRMYYHQTKTGLQRMTLWQFNNPLDAINHWNRVYGPQGLLQFQAVFNSVDANTTLENLLTIIKTHKATPTLAVLKYFNKSGIGMLSFTEPGFTIAIDFINNERARQAIRAMNQLITASHGKVYLAKDLLLDRHQFTSMYPKYPKFCDLLVQNNSPMSSSLSKRLGITEGGKR